MEENRIVPPCDDPYGTKQLHEYFLPMMDDIHSYCTAHGIRYSLSGGSLLGAVRHKGFIPWDDDVDIMFDRENYQKFMESWSAHPMEGYQIVGKTWVKRVTRLDNPVADREMGCIDLFAFDDVPGDRTAARVKILLLQMLQGMMKENTDYTRFSLKYKILLGATWLLGRFFSLEKKQRMYDKLSQWSGKKTSGRLNIYNTWFAQVGKLSFDQSVTSGYTLLPFEGRQFMAIQGYDSYLRELYGDYMQLPPEEDRKPTHKK